MGACWSATKVSGSSSRRNSNNNNQKENKLPSSSSEGPTTVTIKKQKQNPQKHCQQINKDKGHSKRPVGIVPCGKRTDFGYAKDFDKKYSIGKLLGHGQFGYTFVSTDRTNGDRVAVKRIDKNKVIWELGVLKFSHLRLGEYGLKKGIFFFCVCVGVDLVMALFLVFSIGLRFFEFLFFFFLRLDALDFDSRCVLGFNAIQFHFQKLCWFRDLVTGMIYFGGF